MSQKEVIFTIHDGKVTIEASGFSGGACDAATKAFEEVLGGNPTNKTRKSEFYKTETVRLVNQGASK